MSCAIEVFEKLTQNKTKKRLLLHRIVADTFIHNIGNKPCVNHIDGNKLNNSVENLEWCTYSENLNHAICNGLVRHQRYDERPNSRRVYQIDVKTLEVINTFNSVAEASDVTKSNRHHIASVALGKRKTHNGYKWRYENG